MDHTAGIIVIGSGIVGSSSAFHLARSGHDVLLIDKAAGPGDGSTGASSAIVRYEYSALETSLTAWEASFIWRDLRNYLAAPEAEPVARFYETGMFILDAPGFTRDHLRGLAQQVGFKFEEFTPEGLAARVPGIDNGRFWPPKRVDDPAFWDEPAGRLGAVYTPEAGFMDDPRLAAANFARAAFRLGARGLYSTRVTGIGRRDGLWVLTLADGSTAAAPYVVNAAGPWSGEVLALAGVGAEFTITTRPLRQEVHPVAAPAGYNPPGGIGPVMTDEDLGTYFRAEPSGSLIVGGAEPECEPLQWVEGPVDGVDMNRTAHLFESQITRAARRFPGIKIPPRPAGVVGVYDAATDWTPIIDKTDAAGFFVAIGTSGNSFKHGPVIGQYVDLLVRAAEAGQDTDQDPVTWTGPHTGITINLAFFSRRRRPSANSGSVSG
jgi:glycine/D-amino acid oxidase-like deaminating enzyme